MPDEVEGKLIILGAEAEGVYEALGRLDATAGYRVARREVEEITDVYFDSPEAQLFAVGLALRVRKLNHRQMLTIKGETRVQDGVISRSELEVEWSPEGFDEVLEALGFVASPPRQNLRIALALMDDGELVAEVAVDAVSVVAGGHAVRHYEVECEAQGAGDARVVRDVLLDLAERYPELRPWQVSKLEMTQVLDFLAQEGRLSALLDGERPTQDAYDAIEALISA